LSGDLRRPRNHSALGKTSSRLILSHLSGQAKVILAFVCSEFLP